MFREHMIQSLAKDAARLFRFVCSAAVIICLMWIGFTIGVDYGRNKAFIDAFNAMSDQHESLQQKP